MSIFFPGFRKSKQFRRRHFDDREHLAGFHDQGVISWPHDSERAPKSRAIESIEPTLDHEPVAQFGATSIIDLRADNDRIYFGLGHFGEGKAKLFRQKRARYLDEAQISDVVHHTTAVRVEKHHLHFCANARRFMTHCPEITTKVAKDTKLN